MIKKQLDIILDLYRYQGSSRPLIESFYNHLNPRYPFFALPYSHSSSLWQTISSFFANKKYSQIFHHYIQFINDCQTSQDLTNYGNIESSLQQKVKSMIVENNWNKLICEKVISTEELETCTFNGVFIDRSLNLNYQNYNLIEKKKMCYKLEIKSILRSNTFLQQERIMRKYKVEQCQKIYNHPYPQFLEDGQVKRSLYKVTALLKIIRPSSNEATLCKSDHLMQIESFFNYQTNMMEDYLTDMDFMMKGNFFAPANINSLNGLNL